MEEILASIRRIIADESPPAPAAAPAKPAAAERAAAPPPPPPPPPPAADETISEDDLDKLFANESAVANDDFVLPAENEVLELTEDFAADDDDLGIVEGFDPSSADLAFVDPDQDAGFEEEPEVSFDEPEEEAEAAFDEPEPEPPPVVRHRPAAEPARERLISPEVDASIQAAFGSLTNTVLASNPRTIEDLVADMLRPMLKQWLDENLPGLVDRMVRAEIERITRLR